MQVISLISAEDAFPGFSMGYDVGVYDTSEEVRRAYDLGMIEEWLDYQKPRTVEEWAEFKKMHRPEDEMPWRQK